MRRVMQEKDDDCLAACIASLLELPLAEVPNLCPRAKDGDQLHNGMQRWLSRRFGLTLVTVLRPEGVPLAEFICQAAVPADFIASVPVNGGADWHAVIARVRGQRIRLAHDPGGHDRIALSKTHDVSFLTPLRITKGTPCQPPSLSAARSGRGRARSR